jgi:hypothetical protein
MIRGISGGQKKRVTTGEMIAGPKRTLFMVRSPRTLLVLETEMVVAPQYNQPHLIDLTVTITISPPCLCKPEVARCR